MPAHPGLGSATLVDRLSSANYERFEYHTCIFMQFLTFKIKILYFWHASASG